MEGWTEGTVHEEKNNHKRRLGSAPPEAAPVAYTPLSALWKAGQREPLRRKKENKQEIQTISNLALMTCF